MILGNPFQEPVIHIGDSVIFFKRNNLSFHILMILDTIYKNLKKWNTVDSR